MAPAARTARDQVSAGEVDWRVADTIDDLSICQIGAQSHANSRSLAIDSLRIGGPGVESHFVLGLVAFNPNVSDVCLARRDLQHERPIVMEQPAVVDHRWDDLDDLIGGGRTRNGCL